MRRACSPSVNFDSKNIESITRFQLIPPNLVSKDNPIFSAFSKSKLRRLYVFDPNEHKINRSETHNNQKRPKDQISYDSLLLNKVKQQNNMFQGLLKARKSHIKKIKLKEFYIQEHDDKNFVENKTAQNERNVNRLQSKNSTEFNTINSKYSEGTQKNFFLPNRKKLLPAKLRAKSYSNFPKNQRSRSKQTQDENSFFIKVKKSSGFIRTQKSACMTIDQDQTKSQPQVKVDCRKNLRTGKIGKISYFQQKSVKGLEDITLQMNQQSIDFCQQKDIKRVFQRHNRHRRNIKSDHLSNLESVVDINPWMNNHNQDDKENQFFV